MNRISKEEVKYRNFISNLIGRHMCITKDNRDLYCREECPERKICKIIDKKFGR